LRQKQGTKFLHVASKNSATKGRKYDLQGA
jgi:hypothetical protein